MTPPNWPKNADDIAALIAFTNDASSCNFDTSVWTDRVSTIDPPELPAIEQPETAKSLTQKLIDAKWETMGVKELDRQRDHVKHLNAKQLDMRFNAFSSASFVFTNLYTDIPSITCRLIRVNSCSKSGTCTPYDKQLTPYETAILEAVQQNEADSSPQSVLRHTFMPRPGAKVCPKCGEHSKLHLRVEKRRLPPNLAVQRLAWHDDYFGPTQVEFDV